jgi:hypothetical protein
MRSRKTVRLRGRFSARRPKSAIEPWLCAAEAARLLSERILMLKYR